MSDKVMVDLFDERAEPEELEELSLALRRELLDLEDVEDVSRTTEGAAPEGTRGLDMAAIGSLLVTLQPTAAVLGRVVVVLRSWLSRRSGGGPSTMKVTVNGQTIELRPTGEQQQALVEEFIRAAAVPDQS